MRTFLRLALASMLAAIYAGAALQACSAGPDAPFAPRAGKGGSGVDGSAGSVNPGGAGGAGQDAMFNLDQVSPEACSPQCSNDYKAVIGCNGVVIQQCSEDQLCAGTMCKPACEAVKDNKSSVGCDYYPVALTGYGGADTGCFAVFVANTWGKEAHVTLEYNGSQLNPQGFGRIPAGTGSSLTYGPYDAAQGIPSGEVAIFFLQGSGSGVKCPAGVTPATSGAQVSGTGIGQAFHVTTDVPVVAYQMLPYGGGSAAVTGASLLLPTSAWDTNYIAVNAYKQSIAAGTSPTLNLVAAEDGTEITLLPNTDLLGGGGIPGGSANAPVKINLNKGQHAQIVQPQELTGSPIESTKPIGMFAGHQCLNVPADKAYCDHAEQQIPPVRALGYQYVCVTHRPRTSAQENPPWRIIGTQPDTQLVFDPPVYSNTTVQLGELVEFTTSQPFVVKSQDEDHPFIVTTYMTGSTTVSDGYGDADFVRIVPPGQYLSRYVFFTDPTYPETNLVVIRKKNSKDEFKDVTLDCAGPLSGWEAVGSDSMYEYTRTDLIRHDFQAQGACSNGRHVMESDGAFGLWVWGWGTPETSEFTENVSYSYPAGENVVPINTVYIPPVPK